MSRADHYKAIEDRILADVERQEAVVSELWAAFLAAPVFRQVSWPHLSSRIWAPRVGRR